MKTGIYKDMPLEEYHKDRFVISSTGLKFAKKSTRDFAYYVIYGTEEKSQFDFGNAFELAIMDYVNKTDLFNDDVAILPTEKWIEGALKEKPELKVPKNCKYYKDREKDFLQDNSGKYIITDVGDSESKSALDQMVKSCIANPIIMKLLSETQYQQSFIWKDERTGLICKTRPDICKAKKNVIVDIKTCIDASPSGFSKAAGNYDYPLQAVMQIDGAMQSGMMDDVNNYFWLAVEKTPPYNSVLYEFQKDDIEFLMDGYHFYLDRCAQAIKDIANLKDLSSIKSYGERADNKYGILSLDIPLWYRAGLM